jgi:hypothetical protein
MGSLRLFCRNVFRDGDLPTRGATLTATTGNREPRDQPPTTELAPIGDEPDTLPTTTEGTSMDNDQLTERLHAVETAQATQSAAMAGAEATQAAAQAGNMATTAAMTTGTMTTMAAGSISLLVGIFLGLAIRK